MRDVTKIHFPALDGKQYQEWKRKRDSLLDTLQRRGFYNKDEHFYICTEECPGDYAVTLQDKDSGDMARFWESGFLEESIQDYPSSTETNWK